MDLRELQKKEKKNVKHKHEHESDTHHYWSTWNSPQEPCKEVKDQENQGGIKNPFR